MKRKMPLAIGVAVVIIPSVNHALPLQDPEALARAITSFVRAQTPG
jgi:pimeloyl-ACP methyl ester carboxylesterase